MTSFGPDEIPNSLQREPVYLDEPTITQTLAINVKKTVNAIAVDTTGKYVVLGGYVLSDVVHRAISYSFSSQQEGTQRHRSGRTLRPGTYSVFRR